MAAGRIDRAQRASGRGLRRLRLVAVIALSGGVVATLVAVSFVIFPTADRLPRHADVAYVLGPPTPTRVAEAMAMRADGTVDSVLISLAADSVSVPYWKRLCASAGTACIVAKPYTTQGEARALEQMARVRKWRSAVAITQTAHLTRARLVLGRCFSGELAMHASGEPPSGGWAYQLAYQTGATAKALIVDRNC